MASQDDRALRTISLLALVLAGCDSTQSAFAPTSTTAPVATVIVTIPPTATLRPTATPTTPPDIETRLRQTDVYCPTDNEQAIEYYNSAVQLQFVENDPTKAIELYLKAIELDPGYCDAMDNLGVLYRQQGNLDEAIKWYKASIEVFPDNRAAHQNLAFAYLLQGKTTEAAVEYRELIRVARENPEGYYGLGNIYVTLEQYEQAIEQFKQAEELYLKTSSPYVADVRYKLGGAYYLLEEWSTARDYFEQAYPAFENDPAINYFLGVCYLSVEPNNLELARQYIDKARALGVEIPPEILQRIEE